DGDAAADPALRGAEPGDRHRHGLQVADVDGARGEGADHGALEGARGAGDVPGRGDHRPLLQGGGVRAGQPDRQFGGDLDVDQAGHAAGPEQRALPAGLPDDVGVDDRAGLDGLEGVDLDVVGEVRLGLDDAFLADDGALFDPGARHDVGVLADDAAAQVGAGADVDVVVHHGAVQERLGADHRVAAQHGVLAQFGAGLDLGVVADVERALEHRLRVDLGALGHP